MVRKSKPKRKHPDMTTIWVKKSTVKRLTALSRMCDSYDDVLDRTLSGQGEVWVEVLHVDGDSPSKHKVLLKLGEFIYLWDGEKFSPVDPRKVKTIVESVPAG